MLAPQDRREPPIRLACRARVPVARLRALSDDEASFEPPASHEGKADFLLGDFGEYASTAGSRGTH